MSLDSYAQIWNRTLLRVPSLEAPLAQDFVRNAFRRVRDSRRWSWLIQFGQFISPNVYSTGTVTATQGSASVTGTGTAWTTDLLYRQFRIGVTAPIYTIIDIDVPGQVLTLSSPYGGASATDTVYRIYQCFFPVPVDFRAFLTIWDPQNNWRLTPDIKQEQLNIFDAQRATLGYAWLVSYRDTSVYFDGYTAGSAGVPRYELWPHAPGYTYPYLYESFTYDISDPGIPLPRFIRGDMILEFALAEAASFKGTKDQPNPYFNMDVARRHDAHATEMLAQAELLDDETSMQDLMQQFGVPEGYAVPWGSAAFLQNHLISI